MHRQVTQSSAAPARFNLNRAQIVDENFIARVQGAAARPPRDPREVIDDESSLTGQDIIELFESQLIARHQDIESRAMRARNEGFYTIGSAGHEGNAVVGRLTRHTDPAFVHYRSGAFMAERARGAAKTGVGGGVDEFIRHTMLSFAASREEPIAGGRHKVWGSLPLWVPPQTSTIASHLPKAVGTAISLAKARRLKAVPHLAVAPPPDAIVICSFGDASANHAVAQTAFNSAAWAAHQRLPAPILFVCEDNGIGISVETPSGWISAAFANRYGLHYLAADGLDLVAAYRAAKAAVEHCRRNRVPVFLHLRTVRLLGHAGSDPETEYHTWEQIEAAEAQDPLLSSAETIIELGLLTPNAILDLYEDVRGRVKAGAAAAAKTRKLSSADEITASLRPCSPDKVAAEAAHVPVHQERVSLFGSGEKLPENGPPRHMAALINLGLHDLLVQYPQAILFGEDVAKKGGVYHVTTGLTEKFGLGRVFNTLLDETTILGLAAGAGHLGLLPIPEIQYLAYYHNAEDQIRGEACSLQFFSKDQFRNPMVIRIAGWAYQKGFGGHFHNDNSIAALRDVPGLIIATPSRGDDAVKMLRTCTALAKVDGRVVAFIEPIALYMTKDLYAAKDQGWSFAYPPPGEMIAVGEGAVYDTSEGKVEKSKSQNVETEQNRARKGGVPRVPPGSSGDAVRSSSAVTIITWANGVYMSLRAAKTLREQHGIGVRVVDLRWLNPLNETFIIDQALVTRRVLVVDEGRKTGGVGEAILSILCENCGQEVTARRIAARDTYIPLGPAADHVLPQETDIVACVRELMT